VLADGRAWLVDGRMTTVDFLGLMLMRWSRNMPRPATGWPHLRAYIDRLRNRPSFLALNEREGLTDWNP
jgi:glutathione S-transferase